ncbi:MAG: porin family protein, partial [Elusimicrobiota bacterium]
GLDDEFDKELRRKTLTGLKKLIETSLDVEVVDLIGSDRWEHNPNRKTYGTTSEIKGTSAYLVPTYVFKQDKVYPYVGLIFGMEKVDVGGSETKTTDYGVRGGVKVKVGESGLLNIGVEYIKSKDKDTDVKTNTINLALGFSIYL